ncbi:MAG: hypothetical protein NZ901_06085 [Geminocystis sp.]|nr:hypothetical protein [Geminocystis sp.]HIK38402.1 hypothetical protein [Geminocystis sp. M7585_C2015_104]MCS7147747.1 hypothetical protein [Geminocystis sp.]MCX8079233.1 hypothetical protein [Geminocystis sp.]MDW8116679.1 hypothetical protein [Geminocystis sp.]
MSGRDYLNQCRRMLAGAMEKLGVFVGEEEIAEISELITDTMGGRRRYYHNFEHILNFSSQDDPLIIIAALFHDLIYLQVDREIPFNLTTYLYPYLKEKNGSFWLRNNVGNGDKILGICLGLFGLKEGQNLSKFRGRNEFLSALVMARILQPHLPIKILTRLMTIIELTIPFRGIKEKTPPEELHERLWRVNAQFGLGFTDKEIVDTIIQGVKMANIDVSGFATTNFGEFIKNTWLVLQEGNAFFQDNCFYTVKEYCQALISPNRLLSELSPERILLRYKNEPPEEEYKILTDRVVYNLSLGRYFLVSQIVSLSVLQALIAKFTPSLPLSFLFPDVCLSPAEYHSLTDYIRGVNHVDSNPNFPLIGDIFHFLNSEEISRVLPSRELVKLVTFVMKSLPLERLEEIEEKCYLYFEHKIGERELLNSFPGELVSVLQEALGLFMMEKGEQTKGM